MTRFLLCGTEHEEGEGEAFQFVLADHYHNYKGVQPKCLCAEFPLPLYIARLGDQYMLKRWPSTGSQHRYTCSKFEPPIEASGIGSLMGGAIKEEPHTGMSVLSVDFSLKKIRRPEPDPREAPAPDEMAEEVRSPSRGEAKKLSLKSILHFLWDKAEFTRWTPRMQGRRNWAVVGHHLNAAAQLMQIKSQALGQLLHIPLPWSDVEAERLKARRQSFFASYQVRSGPKRLVMVAGEIKAIDASQFGYRLSIRHMPDSRIYLSERKRGEFLQRYAFEWSVFQQNNDRKDIGDTHHLMALFTAAVTETGALQVEEMVAMIVNPQWIPYFSLHDGMVVANAIALKRRFLKPMSYNLGRGRTLPSIILVDTKPLQVNLFVQTPADSDVLNRSREDLIVQSKGHSYVWRTDMPENIYDIIEGLTGTDEAAR